jgi:hypothetical protein
VFNCAQTKTSRCNVMKQDIVDAKSLVTKVKSDCEANMNDYEVLAARVGVNERSVEAENISNQALLVDRINTSADYEKSVLQEVKKLIHVFGNINIPGVDKISYLFFKLKMFSS